MGIFELDNRVAGALGIGVFMGALDLTIVAPALPYISGSLGVTPSAVVLAFSVYAAFYAVAVPLMSRLSDSHGYKPVYAASMLLFAVGSAASALAPTLWVLVAARVVQGIGGGGLFPVAQAIVGVMLPRRRQDKALAALLAVFAAGAVLGPNLGGLLVQHVSWRWIFWINVPLGVLGTLLLTRCAIPVERHDLRVDWAGALLVALTLGSLVLGMERLRSVGDHGFFSPATGGIFVLTLSGLAALVLVERRSRQPIIDLRLITSRAVAPLLVVSLLTGYVLLGTMIFLPLYMQLQFSASAFGGGAVLNAAAVGLGAASYVAGHYTQRFGEDRLIQAGLALMAGGQGLLILFYDHLEGVLAGLVLLGAGLGLAQGPISSLGLTLASSKQQGQISGLLAITRSLGGATGITLAGVLLHGHSRALAGRISGEAGDLGSAAWGSSSSLAALREMPASTQETVRQTLMAGLLDGWYVALGAALLGLALAFLLHTDRKA